MNGVAIGPDSQKNIDALKKAEFLVVGEIYPDETSEFWKSPGITPEEMKTINTTVYRLPCAGFAEKDGSMTNSARWLAMEERSRSSRARLAWIRTLWRRFSHVRELTRRRSSRIHRDLTCRTLTPRHPASRKICATRFLIQASLARRRNGCVLPLQPARRVGHGAVFFSEASAGQAIHRGVDGLSFPPV